MKFIFKNLLLSGFCCVVILSDSFAQQKDAGLWTSVSLEHKVTRKLTVSISEQVRLYQNISDVNQYFTDAGLDYQILPSLRGSINYRLSSRNRQTYFGTRHRVYATLSYRYKRKPFSITLRQRIQSQVESINSSENGKIPEWYSRTKLTVKLDLDKKYAPYLSTEVYYVLDNRDETDNVFDRARYEAGIDYRFNRKHSLNLFYMIQSDILEKKTRDYISGIGYTYTF